MPILSQRVLSKSRHICLFFAVGALKLFKLLICNRIYFQRKVAQSVGLCTLGCVAWKIIKEIYKKYRGYTKFNTVISLCVPGVVYKNKIIQTTYKHQRILNDY